MPGRGTQIGVPFQGATNDSYVSRAFSPVDARGHNRAVKPRRQPTPPPPEGLGAWGATDVVPLAGGHGTVYGTDDLVLKPVEDQQEVEWVARTLYELPRYSTLRIIRPVPARNGAWVVAGWSAGERLAGAASPGRWGDALEISDWFHAAVADVAWSGSIGRHHPCSFGSPRPR